MELIWCEALFWHFISFKVILFFTINSLFCHINVGSKGYYFCIFYETP
jgi:hypothetical protein